MVLGWGGVSKRNVTFGLHLVYIWGVFERCVLTFGVYIGLHLVTLGVFLGWMRLLIMVFKAM